MFEQKCNFSQALYKLPEDGRRPKHVGAVNYAYSSVNLNFYKFNKKCSCW